MPLQSLKRRVRSVTSTKQMTKAMQLVASSKLRHAQANLAAPMAYLAGASELVAKLAAEPLAISHIFYQRFEARPALTIIIGGDRGLAGAYNSNLYRQLSQLVPASRDQHQIIAVGRKTSSHLARFANLDLIAVYEMDETQPAAKLAAPIVAQAVKLYLDGVIGQINLISTEFHSTVKQTATTKQLLPQATVVDASDQFPAEIEPGYLTLLEAAVIRLIEAEIASAIAQARTSEQAARMIAMMNATDNATDLIEDLTLELNTVRQAQITQEIAEITTGVAALT